MTYRIVMADRARIYLSFADEDRARAMELVRWLNDSGWQIAADDRHAFAAHERWSPSGRFDSSDVVLCMITPGWLVSRFCHHEFSYAAAKGKLVLPVICEDFDLGLLPEAVQALPRVDLSRQRVIDYLALKQVLSQTAPRTGNVAGAENDAPAAGAAVWIRREPRVIGLLLTAVLVASIVTFWFWATK